MEEANTQLLEQLESVSKNAFQDTLTGLKTRALLNQEMELYFADDRGDRPPLSFIIFDIDHFKQVNDTLGHAAGDDVLVAVAETIQSFSRKSDTVARFGGEEMVLVMRGANVMDAKIKADLIREAIAKLEFKEKPDFRITVSAGVSSADSFDDYKSLFEAADQALYESKKGGRNQVTVSPARA